MLTTVQNFMAAHYMGSGMVATWLQPDFKIVCVWPFGLLDYGSATLRCKI